MISVPIPVVILGAGLSAWGAFAAVALVWLALASKRARRALTELR